MKVNDSIESKGTISIEISDFEYMRPEIIESVKNAGVYVDPEKRFELFARERCKNYNLWINKRFDYLAFGKKKKASKFRAIRVFKFIFENGGASHIGWVSKIDIVNFFVTPRAGKPTSEDKKNRELFNNKTTLDRILEELEFFEFIEKDAIHQRVKYRIRKEAAAPVDLPDRKLPKQKQVLQYAERKKRTDKQFENLHAALTCAKELLYKLGVEDPDKLIHDTMNSQKKN